MPSDPPFRRPDRTPPAKDAASFGTAGITGRIAPPASSPCFAAEFDPSFIDPQQASDVARWRKATRQTLRAARDGLGVEARRSVGSAIAEYLAAFLQARFGDLSGRVISGYWPIKGEPDLRPLLTRWHEGGAIVALPLVETRAAPLVFRRWTPQTRMQRGIWDIPVPPPGAPIVRPEVALAPLIGWTEDGFRLGYGGGYFDRSLAALSPRPFTIGIGLQAARLNTIFPQPHDIALNAIMTEAGLAVPPRHDGTTGD
ncbi:5-formyltetrahydrofolate cyclo-ligase [Szabonella alba]|uniref:5-formyltetrahydrofolate cyclo-ligase n=1 Tax=Szabonella alba TaxID=2804194 RepID=A0A8K0VA97_9RHOB|nr:5-formyltetrahydrofolate cyclo-ligase [Szabonella alba]MBL4918218.1 5-formyltetrahydrofolate cyclo-ligase [Szabonella alba]